MAFSATVPCHETAFGTAHISADMVAFDVLQLVIITAYLLPRKDYDMMSLKREGVHS